jgi:hypothetical protein
MEWSKYSGYDSPGTIGAKWIGSDEHPKADTNRPVLVYDVKFKMKLNSTCTHMRLSYCWDMKKMSPNIRRTQTPTGTSAKAMVGI